MAKPRFPSGLDVSSQKITNLADPTVGTDAVNLQYLEAFIRGLSWKEDVVAASTANVNVASPGTTLDGVTLSNPSRVLLKDQTAGAENGLYLWTGSATPLVRTTDADTASEIQNATVTVQQGTTNADKSWLLATDNPTLGTTALVWVSFGGGTTYVAGSGIALSGSTFNIGATSGGGITISADDIGNDWSVSARKVVAASTASATMTVTHNFGTKDVSVMVREVANDSVVYPDVVMTSTNAVTITFPSAVGAGDYRAIVVG